MTDQALRDLAQHITEAFPQDVVDAAVALGELTVTISRPAIAKVLTFLRDDPNCRFSMLVDVCGADYPEREQRFEVVYNLLSLKQNQRIRVKILTDAETPVPTVTSVFSTALWFEREAWDMYGILFSDHPDLRRLLTDYGFEGHPLRKDFPLTGHVEVRYDDEARRVVYGPVQLNQEFRAFDFLSPWEGLTPELLPGDEKAESAESADDSDKAESS